MNSQHNFVRTNDPSLYQRGMNNNLKGLNTQFQNSTQVSNNFPNQMDSFQKYNVIPNRGPQTTLINKEYKIVCVVNENNKQISLNNIFKNVSKVQLLSALKLDSSGNTSGINGSDASGGFYSLHITEFSGRGKFGDTTTNNKTLDSFATLDINSDSNYLNLYQTNRDEVNFDPPLNAISNLTFNLYDTTGSLVGDSRIIKYEFIIETVSKVRMY
jgi:hypothetical protein